jgi:hypothetical protein
MLINPMFRIGIQGFRWLHVLVKHLHSHISLLVVRDDSLIRTKDRAKLGPTHFANDFNAA